MLTVSSTLRRLARTAIHTSGNDSAGAGYSRPRTLSSCTSASGPSTARKMSASEISVAGRARTKPPSGPRFDRTSEARFRSRKMSSRYLREMSWLVAIASALRSDPSLAASSAIARTALSTRSEIRIDVHASCAGRGPPRSYNPAVDSPSPSRYDGDEHADVVIIGCGAAGLATARELAGRGRHVIGLDKFDHGHIRGSSHGTERIVRMAYADPVHVEMAVAALDGWRRLEHDAGTALLTPTSGLDAGTSAELDAIATQCAAVGIATERLTADEAAVRFAGDRGPWFRFETDVLYQPRTWTVNADRSLVALRALAEGRGADIRAGSGVTGIDLIDGDGGVIVH